MHFILHTLAAALLLPDDPVGGVSFDDLRDGLVAEFGTRHTDAVASPATRAQEALLETTEDREQSEPTDSLEPADAAGPEDPLDPVAAALAALDKNGDGALDGAELRRGRALRDAIGALLETGMDSNPETGEQVDVVEATRRTLERARQSMDEFLINKIMDAFRTPTTIGGENFDTRGVRLYDGAAESFKSYLESRYHYVFGVDSFASGLMVDDLEKTPQAIAEEFEKLDRVTNDQLGPLQSEKYKKKYKGDLDEPVTVKQLQTNNVRIEHLRGGSLYCWIASKEARLYPATWECAVDSDGNRFCAKPEKLHENSILKSWSRIRC